MQHWLVTLLLWTLGSIGINDAACPCSIEEGKLKCQDNTITEFPEDLSRFECNLDYNSIWGLVIENQPITILKADAFSMFPGLMQIAMSFNDLKTIEKDAFRGMTEVRSLFLKDNNLTLIEEGTLDDLVNLQHLDLRNNPLLESYTTNAWHFCVNTAEFELDRDAPTFYKSFSRSEHTDDYCNTKFDFPIDGCSRKDGVIDCTNVEDLMSAPCNIRNEDFSSILIDFPADKQPVQTEDFHEGESNVFFQEFNSQQGSMEHAKYMTELTLYETKYDLSRMKSVTSNLTELVIIKADTVYMSGPVTINHKVDIRARVVSLEHPITMSMTKDQFTDNDGLEAWSYKEEYYYVSKVLMNRKSFGLVTILQSKFEVPTLQSTDLCHPEVSVVEETNMDVSDWYDVTAINLHYVCATTVMSSLKNPGLVDNIGNFILGFVYNNSLVDQTTFIAAQKFSRLLQLNKLQTVHNVPTYSISTVSSLAHLMYEKMTNYKLNELEQETQLSLATGRATDMKINFESVKLQQQNYFSMEQTVLDSIWASASNNWDFNFDHRNGIEEGITASMNAIQDQIFQMEEEELTRALEEAVYSQEHIDAVINKYEAQITRLNDMVSASVQVQTQLMQKLQINSQNMETEVDNFKQAIEDWKHKQEVKAVFAIFKAVFSFGFGLMTGNPEDLDISEVIGDIVEIYDLLMELVDIIESCQEVQDMINDLDLEDLADINLSMSTSFKDSLQTAVKLKLKGTDFDELERTATVKIDAMNQATNFEISGTDDAMMAMLRVTDVGHQLIDEAADFADVLLKLSEENGNLAVAKEDRERTTQQIEDIKKQLEDLKAQKDQFMEDREKARDEYEQQIEDMKAQYENITTEMREEYKKIITQSFESFQSTFDSLSQNYDRQMFKLIASVHQKFYGLKEHSMNQRAMILSLYMDYCDADFYHSFTKCSDQSLPYMSDDFDTLLDKLIQIQWDSVVSNEELPGTPKVFSGQFDINSTNYLIAGKPNYILETFRNTSEFDINLRELDEITGNRFPDFWRVRIESVTLVLLDKDEKPIQSAGTSFGQEIQIRIRYPTLFNDTDINKNQNAFLAQNYECNSDYVTTGTGIDDIEWRSPCQVGEEFSQRSYKPSPDGIFSFKIENPNTINMKNVEHLVVHFEGTSIRHLSKYYLHFGI